MRALTLEDIRQHPVVEAFIRKGNEHLGAMGYTDHGPEHVSLVSERAADILRRLGGDEREVELAAIAGYLHDVGNVINREGHSQAGAIIVGYLLSELGMDPQETALVTSAIGNHDEGSGQPVNRIAASLILADKSHVHRSRVRNTDVSTFDIHDRVNYAVYDSRLVIGGPGQPISLQIVIDNEICPVMEYFEIFLARMILCRRAAAFLGCRFELVINGAKLL